jgi:hypothetical protein
MMPIHHKFYGPQFSNNSHPKYVFFIWNRHGCYSLTYIAWKSILCILFKHEYHIMLIWIIWTQMLYIYFCCLHMKVMHTTFMFRCEQNNTNHIRLLFNYFCDYFLKNIPRIFWNILEKILNFFLILCFQGFYSKFGKRFHFQKNSNPIPKLIHMFPWYIKNKII